MKAPDFHRSLHPSALEGRLSLASPGSVHSRDRWVLKAVGRGRRVLDLGCGTGALAQKLAARNNELYGVEINPDAAAAARDRGVHVSLSDLNERLPFKKAYFDVVLASEVLEYVYDTRLLIEECARVLRPGGLLLLSAQNLNSLPNRLRMLVGRYPAGMGAYPEDGSGGQVRALNLPKLQELCGLAGFDIVQSRGEGDYRILDKRRRAARGWEKGLTAGLSKTLTGLTRIAPGLSPMILIKAQKRA